MPNISVLQKAVALLLLFATCVALEDLPGFVYREDGYEYGDFKYDEIQNNDVTKLNDSQFAQYSIGQSEVYLFLFEVKWGSGTGDEYLPLVFLTGNSGTGPSDTTASNHVPLLISYTFNVLEFEKDIYEDSSYFELGFYLTLTTLPYNFTQTLWIKVLAPESTNKLDVWDFEIAASQLSPMHAWAGRSFVDVTDTDAHSALITSDNLSTVANWTLDDYNNAQKAYDLYIYDYSYKDQIAAVNNSWLALSSGPALKNVTDLSYTFRGGGLHGQYYVTGLNSSTKYIGVLLLSYHEVVSTAFLSFEFETQSNDACSLIHDLDFCDQVAYSVPASSLEQYSDKTALKQLYDDRARSLFSNFSKSLQQIVCNTTKDAIFSPLGSCEKCNALYKNWLCSVSIPRCSTRNMTGYLPRKKDASRSAFINSDVKPPHDYYEILPCLNVCHIMTRDCPADFAFACPDTNATISQSYYWDDGGEYTSCNFVGFRLLPTNAAQAVHITWTVLLFGLSAAMFL